MTIKVWLACLDFSSGWRLTCRRFIPLPLLSSEFDELCGWSFSGPGPCLDFLGGASNTAAYGFFFWFINNIFWRFFSDYKSNTCFLQKMSKLNVKKKMRHPQYIFPPSRNNHCCTLVNFLHLCVQMHIGNNLNSWDYIVYMCVYVHIYEYVCHEHFLMSLQLFVYNSFCACIVILVP